MKKVIIVIALISLSSCTKNWVCDIETTSSSGTMYHEYKFSGTTQEKNDFEASAANSYEGVSQTVNCH